MISLINNSGTVVDLVLTGSVKKDQKKKIYPRQLMLILVPCGQNQSRNKMFHKIMSIPEHSNCF